VPDLLSVLAHGAPVRAEPVPGAPLELLLVTRLPTDRRRLAAWETGLVRRWPGSRVRLEAVESYRIGWLPPGVLQQSLAAGARLLWGDAAAREVVPRWRPDQLDPRLALDEQAGAEADLAAGWPELAALRAAGALLIARRAYRPTLAGRAGALAESWPEAPPLGSVPPAVFVARARALIVDWLFTWEGGGMGAAGVDRYLAMRAGARAAGAAAHPA
jgi:hypothetical protein